MRHDYSLDLIEALSQWEGVSVEPHRFGGREFKLGKVEIGHVHRGGMLDIPYTVALRAQLVAEGKTGLHHLLADSGWTSFYLREEQDLAQGVWLLKVSRLQKESSRARRDPEKWAALQTQAAELGLSAEVAALIFKAPVQEEGGEA